MSAIADKYSEVLTTLRATGEHRVALRCALELSAAGLVTIKTISDSQQTAVIRPK